MKEKLCKNCASREFTPISENETQCDYCGTIYELQKPQKKFIYKPEYPICFGTAALPISPMYSVDYEID